MTSLDLAPLDDVRVLPVESRRWAGNPRTWAWNTLDELPGLDCASCGRVDSYWGEQVTDGDACRCGSENTTRVLLDVHDRVVS